MATWHIAFIYDVVHPEQESNFAKKIDDSELRYYIIKNKIIYFTSVSQKTKNIFKWPRCATCGYPHVATIKYIIRDVGVTHDQVAIIRDISKNGNEIYFCGCTENVESTRMYDVYIGNLHVDEISKLDDNVIAILFMADHIYGVQLT
jgi:hypothetical protein